MLVAHRFFFYRTKKDHTELRREVRKTGGGVQSPVSDPNVKVLDIIQPELSDLGSGFDSDINLCKFTITSLLISMFSPDI